MLTVNINSTEELLRILNTYPNNFAYRGQSNANWGLQSTLERYVPKVNNRKLFEERSLVKFKSQFNLYSKDMERPDKNLSWLSLMQHYGVPTRLLDFSESPYVALYFAIENLIPDPMGNLAIYAIDYTSMVQCSCDFVMGQNRAFQAYSDSNKFFSNCEGAFDEFLDTHSYDVLWFVDPVQINSRLEKQAGTFLISGSFNKNIDELIESDIYKNTTIEKLVIPHSLFANIYAILRKVNLSPKNIYGDLSGLARDIQLEMRAYNT